MITAGAAVLLAATLARSQPVPHGGVNGTAVSHTVEINEDPLGRKSVYARQHMMPRNIEQDYLRSASVAGSVPRGGNYQASLDVPAGKLKAAANAAPEAFAEVYNADGSYSAGGGSGYASAHVYFNDWITIQGPGPFAPYERLPLILIRVHLDGTLAPGYGTHYRSQNPASLSFSAGGGGLAGYGTSAGGFEIAHNRTVQEGQAALNINEDLEGRLNLVVDGSGRPSGQVTISLSATIHVQAGNGGYGRFENTASFELILPPGYSYTSALGFLTAPQPTAATLNFFRAAAATPTQVRLKWGTLVEVRTLGFHVDRRTPDGNWERVTIGIIPAVGSDQRPHTYEWVDSSAPKADQLTYRLVEVDLSGHEKVVTEAAATPAVVAQVNRAGSGLAMVFRGQPGTVIAVETAPTVAGPWTPVNSMVLDATGAAQVKLDDTAGEPTRFVRWEQQ